MIRTRSRDRLYIAEHGLDAWLEHRPLLRGELYETAFARSNAGMSIQAEDGALVKSNPAMQILLGYSEGQLLTKTYLDITHPADREPERQLRDEMLDGSRDSFVLEKRLVCRDGSLKWTRVSCSMVVDDGDVKLTLCVIDDITDRMRVDAAMKEKDEAIRRAYVEVIGAVTGGRLVLLRTDELQAVLCAPVAPAEVIDDPSALSEIRGTLRQEMREWTPEVGGQEEIVLASCEAFTNVIKHAGTGRFQLRRCRDRLQIQVSDDGPGIDFGMLPRATLLPKFSTKQSLGAGFGIMLDLADRVLLCTDPTGTTVVLEFLGQGKRDEA